MRRIDLNDAFKEFYLVKISFVIFMANGMYIAIIKYSINGLITNVVKLQQNRFFYRTNQRSLLVHSAGGCEDWPGIAMFLAVTGCRKQSAALNTSPRLLMASASNSNLQ